jgi:hypothetical protein
MEMAYKKVAQGQRISWGQALDQKSATNCSMLAEAKKAEAKKSR